MGSPNTEWIAKATPLLGIAKRQSVSLSFPRPSPLLGTCAARRYNRPEQTRT